MPSDRPETGRAPTSARVSTLALLFSLLALLGWILFAVSVHRTHRLDVGAQLFPADHYFTDFYIYTPTFEQYHTPAFSQVVPGRSRFAYPPLVAPIYAAFYSLPHKTSFYIAATLLVWAMLLAWALRTVFKAGGRFMTVLPPLVSAATLAYPALFLFERGNMEIFVWAAVAGGAISFAAGRTRWAAVLFGVATALKLYPVLLFGLLFGVRRPILHVLLGAATAIALSAAAIWFSGPTFGVAARGFLTGISSFQQHYAVTPRFSELRFDHSLFSVVKVLAMQRGHPLDGLTHAYYLVCAVVFGSLFFLRIRRLPWLNQLLYLTVCTLLLPPVSYEYTLVHLYVPALLLAVLLGVGGTTEGSAPTRAGRLAMATLLLLFLPSDLLSVSRTFLPGQVQALALLGVGVLACFPLLQSQSTLPAATCVV